MTRDDASVVVVMALCVVVGAFLGYITATNYNATSHVDNHRTDIYVHLLFDKK